MRHHDVKQRVYQFVERNGFNDFLTVKKTLTGSTELSKDLKITGDDAIGFMSSFSVEFSVDLSRFDFNEYFEEEGFLNIMGFFKKSTHYKPISLKMLVGAASDGVWDSEKLDNLAK